ncbi:30S ribosomal protein S11 [Candidatus Uhrbacteria bacterium CG_4_9_14_3_um_filter_36_7]|uniref:Small ribosomal subunit protein uS11 n=1 Tax=Candidatus Uhrbacteria bacterium CG_4_9_14_3_um_filter_36_7 TaxID=1975033 RepID=A0A2M7XIA8_9BACT|nr:MAG: 30S ribosomal protein S11 [Candidatus Uhrbacteria bacterium CG_4_9_14_3_um_filter_36_7]
MKITRTKTAKAKVHRQVSEGCVYIQATFNNTLITMTDLHGNTLAWSSAGHCGFRGPKKATPYAAGMIIKLLSEKVAEMGLRDVRVYVTGVGSGRDSAIRALHTNGFQVLSIKDTTPIPHNGCRARRPRRM